MRMDHIYIARRVRAQLDIFDLPTHKFAHSKVFDRPSTPAVPYCILIEVTLPTNNILPHNRPCARVLRAAYLLHSISLISRRHPD